MDLSIAIFTAPPVSAIVTLTDPLFGSDAGGAVAGFAAVLPSEGYEQVAAAPDDAAPDGAAPDDAAPDGAAPDGAAPDGAAADITGEETAGVLDATGAPLVDLEEHDVIRANESSRAVTA